MATYSVKTPILTMLKPQLLKFKGYCWALSAPKLKGNVTGIELLLTFRSLPIIASNRLKPAPVAKNPAFFVLSSFIHFV